MVSFSQSQCIVGLRVLSFFICAAVLLASCSESGEDTGNDTASLIASTPAATTSVEGSGTPADPVEPTLIPTVVPTLVPTEAPVSIGPIEPLTGEPLEDFGIMERPALAVKIGTSSVGRPQTGINAADILLEFRVESITRLIAVFHSQGAEPLGPVRSARSSDPDILANFDQPAFGHSGANPGVLREISQAQSEGKLYELRWDNLPSGYWRIADRVPPWNLYTSTSAIWEAAPSFLVAPEPLFEYRSSTEVLPSVAEPSPGVEIQYLGGTVVHFVWDEELAGWARWQDSTPHMDSPRNPDGTIDPSGQSTQVAPANVVVLQTAYTSSSICSYCPEAITVDPQGGTALVFTDGHLIRGRWTRDSASQPWQVTDEDGNPVRLTPGQTFIALPGGDTFVMVKEFAEFLLEDR
ncbi:MAG: DUF3048 domain-containing protein [Acidimicrobiia bacterium]|nr:DUF3048 domain-containing protein [Acidimicrobiia bacterium]MYC57305.1 DUF3048 domain-containing protein [Acidimicrobiia bacterium]MYG94508.1 DUF3048 domain-containing protein [Acidimicrobiia bacterium]MYI31006.1 DUF3048 domain-containing protein [Acidimicrobiia bacterium]